jgi:hypothetical protein
MPMHNIFHPFNERRCHRVKSFLLLPFPTHATIDPWIESGLEFTNCVITIIPKLRRPKQSPKLPIVYEIIQNFEIIHQNFELCNCSIKLSIFTHPS